MGTLTVQTLQAPTSGANANKVIIPSGQTLQLTDNLRYEDMPVGSVLQVATTMWNSETQSTSQSFTDVADSSISFTPKLATSKLVISASHQFQIYSTSSYYAGGMTRIVHDGTALDFQSQTYECYDEDYGLSSGTNTHDRVHRMATVSAGSTNARVIKLQLAKYSATTVHVSVNQGAYFHAVLKVEEIKQ